MDMKLSAWSQSPNVQLTSCDWESKMKNVYGIMSIIKVATILNSQPMINGAE